MPLDDAAGCLALLFEFIFDLLTLGGRVNRKVAIILAIVLVVVVGKLIWDATR